MSNCIFLFAIISVPELCSTGKYGAINTTALNIPVILGQFLPKGKEVERTATPVRGVIAATTESHF